MNVEDFPMSKRLKLAQFIVMRLCFEFGGFMNEHKVDHRGDSDAVNARGMKICATCLLTL